MRNAPAEAYDPFVLSHEEKRRFVAALGDGFGNSHRQGKQLAEAALPADVKAGLLEHQVHYDSSRQSVEFWKKSDGGSERGFFEKDPLNFDFLAVRNYFLEQQAAYLQYAKSTNDYDYEEAIMPPDPRFGFDNGIYRHVLYKTYSKAWYEYHINLIIHQIEKLVEIFSEQTERSRAVGFGFPPIISFSAILGRYLEQYYWKFLIEKAAIRGEKISNSAKSGGNIKASKHKRLHDGWQLVARAAWQENPTRSKMTVARIVKQRLELTLSAKHISRVLTRP
jgi:hypothetical protein